MSDTINPEQIDINGILDLIPHRYPFVMVDRVLALDTENKTIEALKNVTINEPFFQGHFPGKPVMPGVMMVEGLAQAGCVLAFSMHPENVGEKLAFFLGIDKARFRKQVSPGDQLIYKLEILKIKRGIMVMDAKAYVDDQVVVQAEIMASFG